MGRPKGSKNRPKESTVVQTDGYAEAFTGLGTSRDRNSYARAQRGYLLDQQTVTDVYLTTGLGRKIVDVPAEEMTRSGIELEGLDDEDTEKFIEAEFDRLNAMCHFNNAVRWSRLFGGAVIVYGINDGGALDSPLNPQGIKAVEFMRVYDRYEATVEMRVSDPGVDMYGHPEIWQISPHTGGTPYKVHHSRIQVIDGESLPNLLRQQNEGWGASVLQQCLDELKRFGTSHQWALAMLERSQQAIHKIPNLGNTLRQPGGDAMIQKRTNVVDMVRGTLNTVVVDAEEDYDIISASMTGVPDVLDRFGEVLASVSGVPAYILMDRNKGGLSNNNQSAENAWFARIGSMWNDILRKPETKLCDWLLLAKGGDIPDYHLCMKPLTVLSDKEKAEIKKLEADAFKVKADADVALVTVQIIDPTEARGNYDDDYELMPNAPVVDEPQEPVEPNNGNY